MSTFLRDLRYGAASLLREPTFTAIAVLTMALTIGANTAIFSVLHAVLLEPLPYPRAERVVTMYNIYPGVGVTQRGANSAPDYLDRRELREIFESVVLYDNLNANIGEEGSPERVDAIATTPELFSVLGISPAAGRGFTPEETIPGRDKVAIVSHDLARRSFPEPESALGSDLRVNSESYEIVGVLPARFALGTTRPELLVPLALTEEMTGEDARHSNFAGMLARLRDEVSLEGAQERIDALNRANLELYPQYKEVLLSAGFRTPVMVYKDLIVADVKDDLVLLQAGVLAVLLIGCVNVANLMLIRSRRRVKELAVRFALGASRWQVARQLLTESVLLAVVGGGAGVLLALAGVEALDHLGLEQLPRGEAVAVNGPVLLFTLLVSLVTGLLFGLIPVAHVVRTHLASVFREGGRTGTDGRSATVTRSVLVVLQLALAFVLLVGAGLLVVSFRQVLDVDPGFEPRGVLTGMVSLPQGRYASQEEVREFTRRTLTAMKTLPGVEAAMLTDSLPFGNNINASVISFEGQVLAPGENPPVPHWITATPGVLETLGLALLQGRALDENDRADAPGAVMIDRWLAERYFPKGDAVGKRLRMGMGEEELEEGEEARPWYTVVGVVGEARFLDLAEPSEVGKVFFSLDQVPRRTMALGLRAADGNALALAGPVREEILRLDPQLPLFEVRTLEERVDESLITRRTPMLLLSIFAAVALMLAAVGIYGVLAYSVTQRTREIGVRTALGAEPQRVLRLVLGQGGRLIAIGLGLGLATSLLVSRLLESLLYGVPPYDPRTLVLVAGMLGLVSLVACIAPAVRASRVHPIVALQGE